MVADQDTLIPKIQELLAGGAKAGVVREALTKKYDVDTVNTTMLQSLSPKIAELRAGGADDAVIMESLQTGGVIPSVPLGNPTEYFDSNLGDAGQTVEVNNQNNQNDNIINYADNVGAEMQNTVGDPDMVQPQPPTVDLDQEAKFSDVVVLDMPPEDIIKYFNNITNSQERDFKELVGFGSWAKDAEKLREDSNKVMYRELSRRGLDVVDIDDFGVVTYKDPETGEEVTYDAPWYEDVMDYMVGSSLEMGGGLIAATTGARLGFAVGGGYGAVGGALLFGMAGAATGSGADLLNASRKVKYNVGVAELQNRMGEAATADALGALAVDSMFKLSGKVLGGVKQAYTALNNGKLNAAYDALKETTSLNDRQIVDLIRKWEVKTGDVLLSDKFETTGKFSLGDKKSAIRVIAQSEEGTLKNMGEAMGISDGAVKLAKELNARSKSLNDEIAKVSNDNIDLVVDKALSEYTRDVGDVYEAVKVKGTKASEGTKFRFNFNIMDDLTAGIEGELSSIINSEIRTDLRGTITKIKDLVNKTKPNMDLNSQLVGGGSPSKSTSLQDLIVLKQYLNEISSDVRFKRHVNSQQMKQAQANIESEIRKASKVMPDGAEWYKQWRVANTEFSKMKQLADNSLYKVLTNKDISTEKAVSEFANYLGYKGAESYMSVLGKLPKEVRPKVEGTILKQLTKEATTKYSNQFEVIDFPKLHKELSKLSLTTKENRDLKRVVKEMADTFKIDPDLAKLAWDDKSGKIKGNIATTFMGKVQQQVATHIFRYYQAFAWTKSAKRVSLTLQLREVIKNPLNAKSVNELKKQMPNDPELNSLLHKLALEYAKKGQKESYGKVPIFSVTYKGQPKKSTTSLGNGVVKYVDKEQALKAAKRSGGKVVEESQITRLIANEADVEQAVKKVYNRAMKPEDFRDVNIIDALKRNFEGVAKDDKVLTFQ